MSHAVLAQDNFLTLKRKSVTTLSVESALLIGRGKDYQPVGGNKDPQVLADELRTNMKARRDFAWQIVEQMLAPTKVRLPDGSEVDVPLWQTWYDGIAASSANDSTDELPKLFASFFRKLKANPSADLAALAEEVLNEQGQKNLATSLTAERFLSVLSQNSAPTVSTELGGRGRTMFSPSFVKHMMVSAKQVEGCSHVGIKPDTLPPTPDNFSHCIKEFPRNAVMIKTSWRELKGGIPAHDTSAAAMTAVINEGTWPGTNHPSSKPQVVVPTNDQIYVNETADGRRFALAGIHFVTKDVREWVWVSLWWSTDAARDFGADRPSSVTSRNGGVWSNYKMCVGSAFEEGDSAPWSHYAGAQATLAGSIKATYDAIQAHIDRGVVGEIVAGVPDEEFPPGARGPWPAPYNKNTSWCSNPNVEVQAGNGRTSCIGCHQLVLTESRIKSSDRATFLEAIAGYDPQFGRAQNFKNFSADFSWAFQGQFKKIIPDARRAAQFDWP